MIESLTVGVSQRVDVYPERNERRDALDQRLINFLSVSGFFPVPVPNSLVMEMDGSELSYQALDLWLNRIRPKALVLSGGNDLGECSERDITESRMLDYAYKNGLPVLGLCRGMQHMAVWVGGHLKRVSGHVQTRHILKFIGHQEHTHHEVNSYHSWSLAECPENFEVMAQSEDGEIEFIRHKHLPWEGWMWHPEREINFASFDIVGIKKLFNQGNV